MKIEQLEQVLQISKTKSMGQAARALFISQPALSYSIRALETELGAPLFERTAQGMMPTAFGNEFLRYAQPLYEQWEMLQSAAASLSRKTPRSIGITTSHLSLPPKLVTELIESLQEEDYTLNFYEHSMPEILDDLTTGRADIGIIVLSDLQRQQYFEMLSLNRLHYQTICRYPCQNIIVGPASPLYKSPRQSVELSDLDAYPYLSYKNIYSIHAQNYARMGLHHHNRHICVHDRALYYRLLATTDCFAVSTFSAAAFTDTFWPLQLRQIPLHVENHAFDGYEAGWIQREGRRLPPKLMNFLEQLSRQAQTCL